MMIFITSLKTVFLNFLYQKITQFSSFLPYCILWEKVNMPRPQLRSKELYATTLKCVGSKKLFRVLQEILFYILPFIIYSRFCLCQCRHSSSRYTDICRWKSNIQLYNFSLKLSFFLPIGLLIITSIHLI